MALYFHIIELDDRRWACRHGLDHYDQHPTLEQARLHIRALASAQSPASIYLHHRDGSVAHLEDV